MFVSATPARRLLALCGLLPLSEMTQEEVDEVFRRAVEDACEGGVEPATETESPRATPNSPP